MNLELFTEKRETVKEASAHKGLFYPLEIIIFLALFFLAQFIIAYAGYWFKTVTVRNTGSTPSDFSMTIMVLFLTVVYIIIFVPYAVFVQKRSLRGLGFAVKGVNVAREYGSGLLIGLLMMTATVVGEVLIGGIQFKGFALTADLVPPILIIFIAYMIQGMEEEMVSRGFLMISIARRYPLWLGVLTNSFLFGAMHMMNTGVTVFSVLNTVLHGLLYSMFFLRRDSIWQAGGVHAGWNFSQSCIFAQRTSGMPLLASVLSMTSPTGTSFITGGDYGLEASFVSTIVSVIVFVLIMKSSKKLPDQHQAQ